MSDTIEVLSNFKRSITNCDDLDGEMIKALEEALLALEKQEKLKAWIERKIEALEKHLIWEKEHSNNQVKRNDKWISCKTDIKFIEIELNVLKEVLGELK
jgi:uncharacterized protein (DUF342 family)